MKSDVAIIGGSVAGLSAALLLGRCRRQVLVCDAGLPRNRFSSHMHGFLSRDGIAPRDFLRLSREQVAAYPSVRFFDGTIVDVERESDGFVLRSEGGSAFRTRFVLLALGVVDELPNVDGIENFYGTSVHLCPYCDGWEHRDEPVAVWGRGEKGAELAEEMLLWTRDVIYFTEGFPVEEAARARMLRRGIRLEDTPIHALEGLDGRLERICLADGRRTERSALFFVNAQKQQANGLAEKLGCKIDACGCLDLGEGVKTCVNGVFAAGNAATGLQLAIVAASEGTRAAHAINTELFCLDEKS